MSSPASAAQVTPEAAPTPQQSAPVTPPAATPAAPAPAQPQAQAPATPAAEPPKADGGATPATEPPKAADPVVPETYDLKVPEGSLLDAKAVESFTSFAKAQRLSQDQAQALLDRDHAAIASQHEAFTQRQQAWVSELQADKSIGGEAFKESNVHVDRFLARFGTPELAKELEQTGTRHYPALFRALVSAGKELADDTLEGPKDPLGGEQVRHADVLYPSLKQTS